VFVVDAVFDGEVDGVQELVLLTELELDLEFEFEFEAELEFEPELLLLLEFELELELLFVLELELVTLAETDGGHWKRRTREWFESATKRLKFGAGPKASK